MSGCGRSQPGRHSATVGEHGWDRNCPTVFAEHVVTIIYGMAPAVAKWEDIRSTVRADEVVAALGLQVRYTKGAEMWISCPLPSHPGMDRNPSFSVNADKRVYSCFTCGEGGNLLRLVQEVLEVDEGAALRWLRDYSDGPMVEGDAFVKRIDRLLRKKQNPLREAAVLPWFAPSMIDRWVDTETDWFRERGVKDHARKALKLGFSPDHQRDDYTGPAAIIPHFFEGELVGWQERWIDWRKGWAGPPKYTNTDNFPKKTTLYNYDNATEGRPVYVVESAMSVAVLQSWNLPAIATFGTSISPEQVARLRWFAQGLILCPDNDAPGLRAFARLARDLKEYVPVSIVDPEMSDKWDPGEIRSLSQLQAMFHRIRSTL